MKKNIKLAILLTIISVVLILSCCVFAKENAMPFDDVPQKEWYAESVGYAYEKGLMNGITETRFEPETHITRGMIVTIIYRMENSPEVDGDLKFFDVNKTYYYATPIVWATENKIVNGYDEKTFAPEDKITREQFATILYRYANYKGYDTSFDESISEELKGYSDSDLISDYAKDAISWTNSSKLITGVTTTTLVPQGIATRAQAATIFMRLDKLVEQLKENDNSTEETKSEAPVETEPDDEKEVDKPVKEGNSSSNKDVNLKKEPVVSEDKGNNKNEDYKPDNDHDAGEWDNVNSENSKESDNVDKEINVENNANYTNPTLAVDSVSAKSGEAIEVDVKLYNNPGILGALISFEYDDEAMKLLEVKNGNVLSQENEYVFTSPKNKASGCRASWYTLENECSDASGTLVTLCFEVFDSTERGSCPVIIKYNEDDVIDENEENVALEIVNGKIVIE